MEPASSLSSGREERGERRELVCVCVCVCVCELGRGSLNRNMRTRKRERTSVEKQEKKNEGGRGEKMTSDGKKEKLMERLVGEGST